MTCSAYTNPGEIPFPGDPVWRDSLSPSSEHRPFSSESYMGARRSAQEILPSVGAPQLQANGRGGKKKKSLPCTPGPSPHPADRMQDEDGRGSPQTMERNRPTAWAGHNRKTAGTCLEPAHARIPDGGGWSGPQKSLFISLVVFHRQTNTNRLTWQSAVKCSTTYTFQGIFWNLRS